MLHPFYCNFINDLSANIKKHDYQIDNFVNYLIDHIFLKCFIVEKAIMPNNYLLKIWNIIILFLILSNLFIFPIDLVLGINNMRNMY